MVVDYHPTLEQSDPPTLAAASPRVAISVRGVGKMYRIYNRPQDRLKQMLWRGRRLYGREFWAVREISFDVKQGETVGIIGRNGSGKSTLLQIIAGTLAPTEGQVNIRGRTAALLELGSGFNPQFTGRENVYLNGAILGFSQEDMERRFDDIAAFADIGKFIDQPVKLYSSGMVVRLAFAVQACTEPDILIVDEALGVGDVFFQQKCAKYMKGLMQNGTSILFVSHDLSAISRLCQRAMLLADGHMITSGPPKPVLQKYTAVAYSRSVEGNVIGNGAQQPQLQQSQEGLTDISFQPIPQHVFRHGDGGMELLRYAFYTEDEISAAHVEPGTVVRLDLEIVCQEAGLTPNIGFQIRDRFGTIACGTNTYMLSLEMAPQGAGVVFHIAFEITLMLGSGEYTVTVAVTSADPKPERIYDWIDQLTKFVVVPAKDGWVDGLAYCPVHVTSTAVLAQEKADEDER